MADEVETLTRAGWPRPLVAGWPIPWVSPVENLAKTNIGRERAGASAAVCAVCGQDYPQHGTAVVFVNGENGVPDSAEEYAITSIDNAFLHPRCARLALAWCPMLKRMVDAGTLLLFLADVADVYLVFDEDDKVAVRGVVLVKDATPVTAETLSH